MSEKVVDIITKLNEKYPESLALEWDKTGTNIIFPDEKTSVVVVSVDLSLPVVNNAIKKNAKLVIVHHPFIFKPIYKIDTSTLKGKILEKLLKHKISVYSIHTPIDISPEGINYYVADKLGLKDIEGIKCVKKEYLKKIAVFTPLDYVEKVAEAICRAGAGNIGNYSNCTYRTEGYGTFKPLLGANPHIGKIGKIEKVKEIKVEAIFPPQYEKRVIDAMYKAHPYEEPAYDIYKLENVYKEYFLGIKGVLPESLDRESLLNKIKEVFGIEFFRVYNLERKKKIRKIGFCSGSASDIISLLNVNSVDLFITGEISYHSLIETDIPTILLGHYNSETPFIALIEKVLKSLMVKVVIYKEEIIF